MRLNFCILIILTLTAIAPVLSTPITDTTSVTTEELAERIIQEAMKYNGSRYRYGGTGGHGFDCSGFTSFIFEKFGYNLDHSSRGQAKQGRGVNGSFSELQKGDIVVFSGRRKSKTPGHVGIFISLCENGDDFTFIHASTSSGIIVSHMKEPYYDGRFLGARRFIPDFVSSDTTNKDYQFDISNTVVKPDTLSLKESEQKIILLENGKWAKILADGKLEKPSGDEKIVLDPVSGNWSIIKNYRRTIPSALGGTTTSVTSVTASQKEREYSSNVSSTSATTEISSEANTTVYHTIKSGDTLSMIARKYGTTVKNICSLNGITERTILQLGKKLRVK